MEVCQRYKSDTSHCLIDWISDTLSQGCIDLQSLVKCLDHRGIVSVLDTVYVCIQAKVVRLRYALKCIEVHFRGYHYSHVEMMKSKAAEKTIVAAVAGC